MFDIRQDLSIDKEAKATFLTEKSANQISRQDLIISGLNIESRNSLDFVVFKAGNATKLYQRNLKALEKDTIADIQDHLEVMKEEDPDNTESIDPLEKEHGSILGEVCEREAAKLKTFKILHDEKPSKGMIALEKKLSGYTNVTLIYGDIEEHAAPAAGGLLCDTEKKPRRKILTDPKEARAIMRNHM